MRLSGTLLVGLAFAAATVALGLHSFSDIYETAYQTAGRGPVFFPRILLSAMLLLSLLVVLDGLRQKPLQLPARETRTVLAAIAVTALYVFSITAIGFLLATVVFLFLLPLILGYRRLVILAPFSLGYAIGTWYLFEEVFQIILPKSPWFVSF